MYICRGIYHIKFTIMRFRLLVILAVFGFLSVSAKDEPGFVLRGSVVRSDSAKRTPLDSVYISVSAVNDTTPVRFKMLQGDDATKTNATDGAFRAMVYGGPGKYLLTLDREGFEPVVKEVERRFKDQTAVWVGSISMKPERHKQLDELEVVQTAIKVVLKGDTIVYNADAFNLAEGSMLNALVKQLPGAELTADGRIKVNGRFVSSLLLNGKDFFKDDPTVALDNLPAYAVKNVKVYDKAADDDYLTQASQKLDRNEQDENLVMDIVLKKEYSTSWMASLEAGYGTKDRWLGKAFGLGFTDKFRLTAFVNANNVKDYTTATTDGEWHQSWGTSGEMNLQMGGIEYLYDDGKRWKVNGNVTHSHEDILQANQHASTSYYSTGNIYSRSSTRETSDRQHFRTDHNIQYKGDDVFLSTNPNIDWYTMNDHTRDLSATFNQKPDEKTRVEALDSVFRYTVSERYNQILLSRLKQLTHQFTNNFTASLKTGARIRTPKMHGSLNVGLDGQYFSNSVRTRTAYLQHYGGANPGVTDPINTDRFSTKPRTSYNFSPSVNYEQKWTRLTEVHSDELRLTAGVFYQQDHSDDPYDIFEAALTPGEADPTMALKRPEDAIKMLTNSRHTRNHNQEINSSVSLSLSREPVAPSDSGFNPSYNLNISLRDRWYREHLDYSNAADFRQSLRRTRNYLTPNVNFGIRSSNKKRNLNFGVTYSTYTSTPSLSSFIDIPNTDNPLSVNLKNPSGLKDARTHYFRLNFMRYGRGEGRSFTYAYINYSLTDNALGSYQVYNPETGVSRSKTVNVHGNYQLYGWLDHSFSFGARKAWSIDFGLNFNNYHNVGYYIASTDPEATPLHSASDQLSLDGSIGGGYQFKNGSTIRLNFGPGWIHSESDRKDVKAVNNMMYHTDLDAQIELPWDMEFTTRFGVGITRGYVSAAANRTSLMWNASLSKSILKGDLTFKLNANDIFNSASKFAYTYSNALNYNETWQNYLPRYVMLSVIYRFRSLAKGKDKNS